MGSIGGGGLRSSDFSVFGSGKRCSVATPHQQHLPNITLSDRCVNIKADIAFLISSVHLRNSNYPTFASFVVAEEYTRNISSFLNFYRAWLCPCIPSFAIGSIYCVRYGRLSSFSERICSVNLHSCSPSSSSWACFEGSVTLRSGTIWLLLCQLGSHPIGMQLLRPLWTQRREPTP